MMDAEEVRSSLEREFRRLQLQADKALEQVSDDEDFFRCLDAEGNSLAILVKHLAGNLRSRWRCFLTADGEKPDRDRDAEFRIDEADSRVTLMDAWEEGWATLFDVVANLTPAQLAAATVTIRGEPHTVVEALHRQLNHYAYHTGQIVFLAKHLCGLGWHTLSIPRGRSGEFNTAPPPYLRQSHEGDQERE